MTRIHGFNAIFSEAALRQWPAELSAFRRCRTGSPAWWVFNPSLVNENHSKVAWLYKMACRWMVYNGLYWFIMAWNIENLLKTWKTTPLKPSTSQTAWCDWSSWKSFVESNREKWCHRPVLLLDQKIEFLPENQFWEVQKWDLHNAYTTFVVFWCHIHVRGIRGNKNAIFLVARPRRNGLKGFPRIGVPQNIQVSRSIEDLKHPLWRHPPYDSLLDVWNFGNNHHKIPKYMQRLSLWHTISHINLAETWQNKHSCFAIFMFSHVLNRIPHT